MVETDMMNIFMGSEDENKEKQNSIVVPIDDMDTVSSDSPDTVDISNGISYNSTICKENCNYRKS